MMAQIAHSPKSTRIFGCAIFLIAILSYFSEAIGASASHPFATFNFRKMDLDIEDGEVDMLVTFTLGAGSNGIEPAKEAVSLQVTGGAGAYSVTLPAGSFKADRSGAFRFQGIINKVKLDATVRPMPGGAFQFEIITEGANLKGFANPVTVSLTIGDDGASRTVKAEIE